MRSKALFLPVILAMCILLAGCGRKTVYDAKADPNEQLSAAVQKVRDEGTKKFVLMQIGGDWCPWCMRLERLIEEDAELQAALNDKFERVHIYYGKDKKNTDFLRRFRSPQDQGVPALVVLNVEDGTWRIHGTGIFEEGDGYDRESLLAFFRTYGMSDDGGEAESVVQAGAVVEAEEWAGEQ